MKALTLALFLSLPMPRLAPQFRAPADPVTQRAHKGGRWYMAESGHAVYCYGPVRVLPLAPGRMQKVATYCQGDRLMVPLKD